MSDRTAAHIFSEAFNMLTQGLTDEEMGRKLWKLSEKFDFNLYDMESAWEALIELGLAEECSRHSGYVIIWDECPACEEDDDND